MATPRPAMLPHDPHSQPWLHFTPRTHTIRRTATGVLAGYFEPRLFRRGALAPLANTNGVVSGYARVAGDRGAKEKERRLARRKQKEGKSRKEREQMDPIPGQSRPLHSRTVSFSADSTFVTPSLASNQPDESPSTTSNSLPTIPHPPPLTSSICSTPQRQSSATPTASLPTLESDRLPSQKKRKRAARPAPNRASTETSLDCPSLETDNDDDDDLPPSKAVRPNESRPRGRPPGRPPKPRPPQQPPSQSQPPSDPGDPDDPRPKRSKKKSRKGWKGWIELESSPEPNPKGTLIKLDEPVLMERKTRSGKFFDTMITYPDSPRSESSGLPATSTRQLV